MASDVPSFRLCVRTQTTAAVATQRPPVRHIIIVRVAPTGTPHKPIKMCDMEKGCQTAIRSARRRKIKTDFRHAPSVCTHVLPRTMAMTRIMHAECYAS